jgi:hypothetical protein
MRQTGHKSIEMVLRYVRQANALRTMLCCRWTFRMAINIGELQALGRRLSIIGSGPIVIAVLYLCQRSFEQHLHSFIKVFSQHLAVMKT